MAWYEGRVNSRQLVKTVLDKIVNSGCGWEYVPSFYSNDVYVDCSTRDGIVIKNTVNGNEIFMGFHQVLYSSSSLLLVVSVYTDFKASPTLDTKGTYKDVKYHHFFMGRLADSGTLTDTAGYGMRYKLSVTNERVVLATICEQSTFNQWSVYMFGAPRNTSDNGYNKNAFAVFTSWSLSTSGFHELLLYHRGDKFPQLTYCQGILNLGGNGNVGASELISPLRIKNANLGNEGFVDMYISISENAFREGDEIEINGRIYTAITVNMYPRTHSPSYANSLHYAHVGICNVLIPKE